ncbi:MAG TPA: hypothetical protein VFE41_18110 [Acetobacteraceae bacterium]|jgi:hypothetical protein|nr:hypothetical protein [Acetobacteraceae bacterium]
MGSSNIAARRGAKANRRKAIVAEKRKAEAGGNTLAGRVARAAAAPVLHCLLTESLHETGIGTLVLARRSALGQVTAAGFLLDVFCLGVKDVMFRAMEGRQLGTYLDMLGAATPLVPVDPGYARKLLRDLVLWSGSLGFQPHPDFATVERLFGDVDPQTCKTAFQFGHGGKPLYVSGPSEPPLLVRHRIEQLSGQLGSDGFDYIVPAHDSAW